MSPLLNFRTPLVCLLIFSLFITGSLTITTPQSHASNKSLPRYLNPSVNVSSEETAPQAETVDEATRSRVTEAYGKLPLSFEENRGQVDKEVKYISRGSGYTMFLTPTEAVLTLQRSDGKKAATTAADALHSRVPTQAHSLRTSVLRMKLKGANHSPAVSGESEMGVRTNYFIGNDPERWQTDVARYERVKYSQVYPGIDMIYYGQQQELEYDFEVAPGADVRRIALEFTGVKRVKIERKTGDLLLQTAGGEVRQRKPLAYQEVGGERREVASRYVMQGKSRVGIEVREYDRAKRLVIDPVLSYSTYLGGSKGDVGTSIAVDAAGIAYVTGYTYSVDFPTRHPYQTEHDNDDRYTDVFVAKFNTNAEGAASLLYSTYLGGSHDYTYAYLNDVATGIAIDASGIAYVTGYTNSIDFPTKNQYQTQQSYRDAFVTKLNTNASGAASLLYSTYLGGSEDDYSYGIAVNSSGIAYVTGETASPDFPTLNPYQTGNGTFVTKLDTNISGTSALLYSTILRGCGSSSIAVDSSGIAYVTGSAAGPNLPKLHQYQAFRGGVDAFVAKIDTNASGAASLLYSTYLGGSYSDYGTGIAVDSSGHAYVTGYTDSTNFPIRNQYQQTYQSHSYPGDAFVTKLDTNASGAASLLYSTYLGGDSNDFAHGIAVDAEGHAYVTGETASPDFPTLNPYQQYHGGFDAFVTKLDTNASGAASLVFSTYLGGNFGYAYDSGKAIALDSSDHIYVTGYTLAGDFPTLNQYQTQQSFYWSDAFVTKLTDTTFISGRVTSDGASGFRGVTVTLSGSESRTTVTDATGSYSFLNLPLGGNYTVTPSKRSLTFFPSEQSYTDLQANQTNVNFNICPIISGKVTKDTATGAGVPGVTITLTGGASFMPLTFNTASGGAYSFCNVPTPGNYKLTPSSTYYNFSPAQLVLNDVTDQMDANFIATLKTFTISGVVKLGAAGLSGVTVTLTSSTPAGFAPRTVTTSSTGAYSFTGVPAGRNYKVTPTKTGYRFTQTSRSFANLSANQTAVNFFVEVYSISGRITQRGTTTGISAVTVMLSSPTPAGYAARSTRTTSTGDYKFMNLPAGRNYTIKPAKSGFTFTPASRSITNLSGNISAGASSNFTGTGQ